MGPTAYLQREEVKTRPDNDLWAIFVPGPNEYQAMPSEQAAKDMATRHNAEMAGSAEIVRQVEALGLSVQQLDVVACPWPRSADEHADDLRLSFPTGHPK